MGKVSLFGASGHAKVIIDILIQSNIKIEGIFDDNQSVKTILRKPVTTFSQEQVNSNSQFIISIGNNKIREVLSKKLSIFQFAKAIHPSSCIDETSNILEGTVVMAGAIINSSVKIGKHCIINTAATIDHDCIVHDFAHISPNATLCGNVVVGSGTQVGAGAVIIPNITIGKNVVIGAGSVVVKDIPDNVIVMGNPSKIIKKVENE